MQQAIKTWPLVGFTYRYFWQNKYVLLGRFFSLMLLLLGLVVLCSFCKGTFVKTLDDSIWPFFQTNFLAILGYSVAILLIVLSLLATQYTISRNVLIDTPISINPLQNIFKKNFWVWLSRLILVFFCIGIVFCAPTAIILNYFDQIDPDNKILSRPFSICLAAPILLIAFIVTFRCYFKALYYTTSIIANNPRKKIKDILYMKSLVWPIYKISFINFAFTLPLILFSCVVLLSPLLLFKFAISEIFQEHLDNAFFIVSQVIYTSLSVLGIDRYYRLREEQARQLPVITSDEAINTVSVDQP